MSMPLLHISGPTNHIGTHFFKKTSMLGLAQTIVSIHIYSLYFCSLKLNILSIILYYITSTCSQMWEYQDKERKQNRTQHK